MNILIDINHPGQVHLFRNVINLLNLKKHKVIVTVKDIPEIKTLLNIFDLPYTIIGRKYDAIFFKGLSQIRYNYNLYKIASKEQIDVAIGSSITISHVSIIHKTKSIILDDDDAEAVKLFSLFAHPFADCILSPAPLAHQRKSPRELTYNGTHELFYLHPKYFSPDPRVLNDVGVKEKEKYFILRFVSGKAYHDFGEKLMTLSQKLELVELLEKHGRVFITTERDLEDELIKWQLNISPEKIHHLMFYSTLFLGDSQTMTSEAAILGTPALKCNSFAHKLSVPNMLEDKYGLCYSFQPYEFDMMLGKIIELLSFINLKDEWHLRREQFLDESIDPTSFLVWFVENYPNSLRIMKNNPDYQYNFR